MAVEPRRLSLADLHPARESNLERPLAQSYPGHLTHRERQVEVGKPVQVINLPVQLLLLGDHQTTNSFPFRLTAGEQLHRRRRIHEKRSRLDRR